MLLTRTWSASCTPSSTDAATVIKRAVLQFTFDWVEYAEISGLVSSTSEARKQPPAHASRDVIKLFVPFPLGVPSPHVSILTQSVPAKVQGSSISAPSSPSSLVIDGADQPHKPAPSNADRWSLLRVPPASLVVTVDESLPGRRS